MSDWCQVEQTLLGISWRRQDIKLFEMLILATSPACIVFKIIPKCPHPLLVSTFHTHPHASLSTVETKMATLKGQCSILTMLWKNKRL